VQALNQLAHHLALSVWTWYYIVKRRNFASNAGKNETTAQV